MTVHRLLQVFCAFLAATACATAADRMHHRSGDAGRPAPGSRTYSMAFFRGSHHDDVDGIGLGFFPMHRNVSGVEIGLLGEVLDGDLRGFGWGTLWSVVGGGLRGGQFAFLTCIADEPSAGCQISGVASSAGEFSGVQLALLHNKAKAMEGVQLSLLANTVGGDLSGVQMAIVNRAAKVRGVQFGLLNFADSLYGVQIGLGNSVNDSPLPWMPILNASF